MALCCGEYYKPVELRHVFHILRFLHRLGAFLLISIVQRTKRGQVYFVIICFLVLKILLTEVKCISRWSATSLWVYPCSKTALPMLLSLSPLSPSTYGYRSTAACLSKDSRRVYQ
jgi:hypothetical protein